MQIGQQTPAHPGWQRPQADQHYKIPFFSDCGRLSGPAPRANATVHCFPPLALCGLYFALAAELPGKLTGHRLADYFPKGQKFLLFT